MSYADIWSHSEAVARALRGSSQVSGLVRVFDREGDHGPLHPGERALGDLNATLGMLGSRPLLVGLFAPQLPPMPDEMPGRDFEDLLRMPEFRALMDDAHVVAETLLCVIEEIRAKLPGYPDLPVPSLMPQAPSVEMDGMLGTGMPWPASFRQPAAPAAADRRPALAGVAAEELAAHVHDLCEAVQGIEEWSAFVTISAELGGQFRDELRSACAEFERRTTATVLDEEAGGRLISRAQYTRALLDEVAEGLSPEAGAYLRAFDGVDRVLSDAGTVISDRTVHRTPVPVPDDAEVRWQREGERVVVNARFSGDPFLKPGRLLVYDGEPPVRGAWLATATTMNLGFGSGGLSIGLDAVVLPDSERLLDFAFPADEADDS